MRGCNGLLDTFSRLPDRVVIRQGIDRFMLREGKTCTLAILSYSSEMRAEIVLTNKFIQLSEQ